ncbi:MAG: endonuclease domain-containing protein [Ruminococcaceae bacterium]|nr:endonuclease domain-containing protein [Oscillospiraceae bacterium]
MSKHLPSNKELRTNAQNLRKQATKWEKHLWYDFLKNYPIQFNRQKNIGEYIVDFYCKQASLVIELDGEYHRDDDASRKDEKRTKYLEDFGITVLRFKNREIDAEFTKVCDKIDAMVKSLISHLR